MDADRDAPAFAEGEVLVDAPRAIVWLVLTDVVRWPQWSPGVTVATINGDVEPGTEFRWRSGRSTIRSKLVDVTPPVEISWTGRATGIKATHSWQLDERGAGTIVRTQESWRGIVPKLLSRSIQPTLQQAVDDALAALKAESERRTDTEPGPSPVPPI
ncbi:MAG: SRPBCC family protein [Acidimicrobiia bacterium]